MFDLHIQSPDRFVESIRFTALKYGFLDVLVEKDYFCSILLCGIYKNKNHGLIFKGGTLLSKVHAGFYRLSEDLDFSIDTNPSESRNSRRSILNRAKTRVEQVVVDLGLSFSTVFQNYNENKGSSAAVQYDSLVLNQKQDVRIDISAKERVMQPCQLKACTMLCDVISQKPAVDPFLLWGLSLNETYAEKLRAALSRREPAIRDIFDVYYAIQSGLIQPSSVAAMTKSKMEALGEKSNLSENRKQALRQQLPTDLQPVLTPNNFNEFDFEAAWQSICNIRIQHQLP